MRTILSRVKPPVLPADLFGSVGTTAACNAVPPICGGHIDILRPSRSPHRAEVRNADAVSGPPLALWRPDRSLTPPHLTPGI